MTYQKRKKMTDEMAGAFFTVEAAILYPLVLAVVVLMVYLLFFQYDRCLLDQDIGKAAVQNAGKWTLTWEGEAARWILEKNDIVVEKAGRLKYPFSGLGTNEKNWSAKASFRVDRSSPVFYLRRIATPGNKTEENIEENTEENIEENAD